MVVAAIAPVVYVLVVAAGVVNNNVPPVAALYHMKVPEVADVAVSITVPFPQRGTSDAVGAGGTVFIVAVTAARALLTQVPLSNST